MKCLARSRFASGLVIGFSCLIWLVSQAPPAAAQRGVSPAQINAGDAEIARFFDSYMRRMIAEHELPGGAVVVVRDGRTILQAGYGTADFASQRAVDPERDIFRAASISKLLPWILVMQEVERGRLDLDRDIADYLDFKIPRTFPQPITMRHLMTHSAGFADRFHGVLSSDRGRPLGAVLGENLPERVYPPGSTVAYSNYGAALAGYIVQRIDGRPWDVLVRERLLKPLQMTRSTVLQPVPADLAPWLAGTYAYGSERPAAFRTTPLAPMGSLSATPSDMGRLLKMLVDGGRAADGQIILSPASVANMTRLERPLAKNLDGGFGLGTLAGTYRGVRFAGHAGNMTTLATDLEVLPDHGLGWYFVFNGQGINDIARSARTDLLITAIDTLFAGLPDKGAQVSATARPFSGVFVSTRRQQRGPMMFNALMDTLEVYPSDDGTIYTYNSGVERRWLPAGTDLWHEEKTGITMAAVRDQEGGVARVASWLLYPASEFEVAPSYVGIVEMVLKGSLGLLALAGFGKVLLIMWTRRLGRAAGLGSLDLISPSSASRLHAAAFLGIVICLLGWSAF